ncbi:MAG TPA: flagellar basal body rod protein FlgB [Burkholderiaceae bacterium]|nr:flagellar basal body rod protein FlgB [Burkholderiaceae bacterium]
MDNRLTANFDFHARALELRSERQRVLSSNIANADTPGYAARDFKFTEALAQATGKSLNGGLPAAPALSATREGHLGRGGAQAGGPPELLYRSAEQASMDGNTVSMDRERASFADNAVRYEATLRFINGNIRTMLSAITGQ